MRDFFTRMAERALGTAPRIDPQAGSRYELSRLPLPELDRSPSGPKADLRNHLPDRNRVGISSSPQISEPLLESPIEVRAGDKPPVWETRRRPLDTEPGPGPVATSTNKPAENLAAPAPGETLTPVASFRPVASLSPVASFREAPIVVNHPPAAISPTAISAEPRDPDGEDLATAARTGERSIASLRKGKSPLDESRSPMASGRRDVDKGLSPVSDDFHSPGPMEGAVIDNRAQSPRAVTVESRPTAGNTISAVVSNAAGRAQFKEEPAENGAPSIRVTIGRVEVRAVSPPATPAAPVAPATPKLSLDEFLRQHNGRRR